MTFAIITRTYKTDTIQILKDNIKKVFGQKKNYVHYIICDLTGGVKVEQFEQFADEHTKLFLVDKNTKIDKYCAYNIDALVRTLREHEDYWIYILDHDNLLKSNFPSLENFCKKEYPVIVFNIQSPPIWKGFDGTVKAPLEYKKALFHINSANYLVHISVFDKCGHGNKVKSDWHDGIFMQKVLYYKMPIKYLNGYYGYNNALKFNLGD